jgi:hypothetical protein
MRIRSLVAVAAVSTFVLPALSFGQSLAEAAAREKARRKALAESNKKPAKSYSDADLSNAKGKNASFPNGSDAQASTDADGNKDAASPGTKPEKTEEQQQAEAAAAWRKNLDAANAEATGYREQIAKIQNDLNDTSGGIYSSRRATMLSQLEGANKKLTEAEAKIADLEDQGRRNRYH